MHKALTLNRKMCLHCFCPSHEQYFYVLGTEVYGDSLSRFLLHVLSISSTINGVMEAWSDADNILIIDN